MTPELVVNQSTESGSDFLFECAGIPVKLTFLSSTKGRMEFAAELDGEPKGKINVLSQHSITRMAKTYDDKDKREEFVATMLKAGVILRDGTYVIATVADKVDAEKESLTGADSSYGEIDEKSIGTFLGQRFLLDEINEILHESRETPFVGDDANLLLTFLVFLSCKTDNPLNLEMIGQSSSGKTYMTLTARNGFPKSMIMVLAGASKEALKYDYDEIDEDGNFIVNVDGRCIVVLEKDESYGFIRKMKPIMSGDDDELIWKTPIKNELTGEIETRDFIIRGRPSFITLTTRNPSEEEQITRQLIMTPDTTIEKVGDVVRNALMQKARPERYTVHSDLKMLQASMLSLNRYKVRNIFAPLMVNFFPARNAQHQRDIGKVLSIIDAVTLLHQKQRPVQTGADGQEYLLSSIEDNVIALILCDLVLRASLSGVPDDTWTVYQQMVAMDESKRPLTEDNILQWLGIHAFTISKNALKEKHLPTLEDAGLIEVARRGGGRAGGKKSFKIVKSRAGLMDDYALSPLFIESASANLPELIKEYSDVLEESVAPVDTFPLKGRDASLIRDLGCPNKEASLVWRALFLPTYLRPAGRNHLLWEIVGKDSKHRDSLFAGDAWFNAETAIATNALKNRREVKQAIKTASQSPELHKDDLWEAMMEAQLAALEDD
jgi:hypothetical protein|tara:strand:+ start:545 stop:2536 length:1992 start_codon:yes stop_codon:yes gene_type:complete